MNARLSSCRHAVRPSDGSGEGDGEGQVVCMMSWQELADKSKKKTEEPELRDAEDKEESEAQEQGGQQ